MPHISLHGEYSVLPNGLYGSRKKILPPRTLNHSHSCDPCNNKIPTPTAREFCHDLALKCLFLKNISEKLVSLKIAIRHEKYCVDCVFCTVMKWLQSQCDEYIYTPTGYMQTELMYICVGRACQSSELCHRTLSRFPCQ